MEPMADANNLEQAMMRRAKTQGIPLNGSLELTPLCNLNCEMCYVRLSREEMERQGRLRTVEEWLALGREMQKAGVLFLLLTGGEPLLYPDFKKLYLGLRELGMVLTVNTNGTMIDEEWADFFAQYKPRRINITLYGPDAETYAALCRSADGYDRTVRAVRLLTERGVDVRLGASAARSNEGKIADIIRCGDELGVPVRTETYMMPAERERQQPYDMQARLDPVNAARIRIAALKQEMGPEIFARYVAETAMMVEAFQPSDEPRRMTCYAGNCSFTVNWQGFIRPCVVLAQPSVNVFEVGFAEAWQQIRTGCSAVRLNVKCSACRLRPVCRTCAAAALLETGSFDGVPDYVCRYAEESWRLVQEEWEALKRKAEQHRREAEEQDHA